MMIRIERIYRHAPETLWAALTDARAIRQWWVDTDFAPEVGRRFFFQDAPQGSWDGRVTGTVLEADPPRRVRFSWVGGGHETVVTYELEPLSEGRTRLMLTHEGFKGLSGLFLSVLLRFGWRDLVRRTLPETAAHVASSGLHLPFPSPSKAARARPKVAAG